MKARDTGRPQLFLGLFDWCGLLSFDPRAFWAPLWRAQVASYQF